MSQEIESAKTALIAALRKHSHPHVVSFRLFVNCEEAKGEESRRTPEDLAAAGISMRNLCGDFIRQEGPGDESARRRQEAYSDLLAACRLAAQYHQGAHSVPGNALRDAIAKATGS